MALLAIIKNSIIVVIARSNLVDDVLNYRAIKILAKLVYAKIHCLK